jgi:hypothetical protein
MLGLEQEATSTGNTASLGVDTGTSFFNATFVAQLPTGSTIDDPISSHMEQPTNPTLTPKPTEIPTTIPDPDFQSTNVPTASLSSQAPFPSDQQKVEQVPIAPVSIIQAPIPLIPPTFSPTSMEEASVAADPPVLLTNSPVPQPTSISPMLSSIQTAIPTFGPGPVAFTQAPFPPIPPTFDPTSIEELSGLLDPPIASQSPTVPQPTHTDAIPPFTQTTIPTFAAAPVAVAPHSTGLPTTLMLPPVPQPTSIPELPLSSQTPFPSGPAPVAVLPLPIEPSTTLTNPPIPQPTVPPTLPPSTQVPFPAIPPTFDPFPTSAVPVSHVPIPAIPPTFSPTSDAEVAVPTAPMTTQPVLQPTQAAPSPYHGPQPVAYSESPPPYPPPVPTDNHTKPPIKIETRTAKYIAVWGAATEYCEYLSSNVFFSCHDGGIITIFDTVNAECRKLSDDYLQCEQKELWFDSYVEFTCSGIKGSHVMATANVGPSSARNCTENGSAIKYLTISRTCYDDDGYEIQDRQHNCDAGQPLLHGDIEYCTSTSFCLDKGEYCKALEVGSVTMSHIEKDHKCSRVDLDLDLQHYPFREAHLRSVNQIDWKFSGKGRGCQWEASPLVLRCENGGQIDFLEPYEFCQSFPEDNVAACQSFAPFSSATEESKELLVSCTGKNEEQLVLAVEIPFEDMDVMCTPQGFAIQSIMLSRGCGELDTENFGFKNDPIFCNDPSQLFVIDEYKSYCFAGDTCQYAGGCENLQLPVVSAHTGMDDFGQCIYVV